MLLESPKGCDSITVEVRVSGTGYRVWALRI